MTVDTAVILAGGKGLRLLPITKEMPKAMVMVLNRPLIEWLLLWLKKHKIRKIVISVDHKKEVLINSLGNGKQLGLKITYNDHHGAKDTGDAFRSVFKNINLPNVFLAMNGDQIIDLPIKQLIRHHQKYNPIATIVTCPVRNPFGIIDLGENHFIKDFLEKPVLSNMFMNAGVYIFNKSIEKYLPQKGSIEKTTFKKLAKNGKLLAYVHDGLFTTINDHKDLQNAKKILNKSKINFL